jgi:hypothetical protein
MQIYMGRYPGKRAKKKERAIRIRIDNYDLWNMDHTLALIIHPMLVRLKEIKHGAPGVDNEDVPEELRAEQQVDDQGKTDNNWHERWDWVLNEMIWAFQQLAEGGNEEQFSSGELDILWVPVDIKGNEVPKEKAKLFRMERGPNDTHKRDNEGLEAHRYRIANGLRLFGKYYQALWD